MKKALVIFNIQSYWHAGSGEGRGGDVDATPERSNGGLPYLPGKTVKGLLREAVQLAEDFGHVDNGATERLFGRPTTEGKPDSSIPGCLLFTGATLPREFEQWAGSDMKNMVRTDALFEQLAATKIDENGIAVKKSLRGIDVAVPLSLTAYVDELPGAPEDWVSTLQYAAPIIRSLGSHRHRGLGRVKVTVSEEDQ